MPAKSILVVDDTQSVLNMTHIMLGNAGYEVVCVGSGLDAIEMVKGREFDLVLMDVVMDGMSGPQAARAIRLMRPDMPIIFMSGFPDQLEKLRAETVIQKPFTQDVLVRRVDCVLSHS